MGTGRNFSGPVCARNAVFHLNCTQVCYSFYENGKRDIPTQVLIRLAAYYGVSIDYLLGQTDNPARNK
ncbi:MAG: helix-turn-helix transcriptional regulator [Lachnospiraceae bacterium]